MSNGSTCPWAHIACFSATTFPPPRHIDHWKGLDGPDHELPRQKMCETLLEVHILPAVEAPPAAVAVQLFRL